ncbi:MAG: putative membrane protein [Arcticibacterium sp.]|jgi:uncharacterized membrane protein
MTRIAKSVLNYFIRGLIFIAPVGLTILLLYNAFNFVDNLITIENTRIVPGLGFLLVVGGTALIGFIFTRLLPNTIQNWIENSIQNLPLVRLFYSAFKDLISAFVGDKKKFKQPVLVTLNKDNHIYKLGFLTQESLSQIDKKNFVSVYCPHSYAFSGDMFILPKENVKILDLSSSEAMKIIISGGVSFSDSE